MSSFERELRQSIEFLPGRLYYVASSTTPPSGQSTKHFFSIDNELVYWNFFLDFGPLNLGHVFKFCVKLNGKLADPLLKDKVIYFYSGTHVHRRTNAAFLISAWAMLCLGKSPEEAFRPFRNIASTLAPWHDATPTACTFNLTVLDTLRGLAKAREHRFFDFENFNLSEYEYYEQVENGDLNWCMDGKFIAFAGPHATREMTPGGYHSLCPDDYVSYFKRKNVTLVVRLNKKYYDSKKFSGQGIDHMDLYFVDGSNPPDHILAKFIKKSEETPGAVAVHCKAGLGRTGSCIGAYMMKHFKFTAEECIGWLRIVRPGSIIGPQQQFMKEIQPKMWREGEIMRARLTPLSSSKQNSSSVVVAVQGMDDSGTTSGTLVGGAGSNSANSSGKGGIATVGGKQSLSSSSILPSNNSSSSSGMVSSMGSGSSSSSPGKLLPSLGSMSAAAAAAGFSNSGYGLQGSGTTNVSGVSSSGGTLLPSSHSAQGYQGQQGQSSSLFSGSAPASRSNSNKMLLPSTGVGQAASESTSRDDLPSLNAMGSSSSRGIGIGIGAAENEDSVLESQGDQLRFRRQQQFLEHHNHQLQEQQQQHRAALGSVFPPTLLTGQSGGSQTPSKGTSTPTRGGYLGSFLSSWK